MRQRTQTINAPRAHLAEFGIVAPQGAFHAARLARALEDPGLPDRVHALTTPLFDRIVALDAETSGLAKEFGEAADDLPGGRAGHGDGAACPCTAARERPATC
ncbi:MAG: hypothetical protein OXI95_14260 [bacterium]|nr:hypothetical protein [bacterium]